MKLFIAVLKLKKPEVEKLKKKLKEEVENEVEIGLLLELFEVASDLKQCGSKSGCQKLAKKYNFEPTDSECADIELVLSLIMIGILKDLEELHSKFLINHLTLN